MKLEPLCLPDLDEIPLEKTVPAHAQLSALQMAITTGLLSELSKSGHAKEQLQTLSDEFLTPFFQTVPGLTNAPRF